MFQLILKSENAPNIPVNMEGYEDSIFNREQLRFPKVYYDRKYDLAIEGLEKELKNVYIYINDVNVKVIYQKELGVYIEEDKKTLFKDCFGFARITLKLIFEDETEELRFSEYLSVLYRKGYMSEKVDAMYDYIFQNGRQLLYKSEQNIVSTSFDDRERRDSIFAKLNLASEIAIFYENNFGYFKANSKFKVTQKYAVDNIEKLKYLSPRTLEYMATHPEHFKQIVGEQGIKIQGTYYYPEKTLVPQDDITVDIYENRVIVGFLGSVLSGLLDIEKQVKQLMNNIPEFQVSEESYIHSAFSILRNTKVILSEKESLCRELINKFQTLYSMYQRTMFVLPEEINTPPKPTAIFLSTPKYNMIFNSICQWFDYGEYDDREEAFMLSIINISSMYELFILCKMINDLKHTGYVLNSSERYIYRFPYKTLYNNSDCYNTYYFSKDNEELVLYYQPVIYCGFNNHNRIGLYRNTTIQFDGSFGNVSYYTPDYVIKRIVDGKSKYDIIDAKFRNRNRTIGTFPELSYKYLFSISTMKDSDQIEGLYIIYGKDNDEAEMSVYDCELENQRILPKAMIIPMSEKRLSINMISYMAWQKNN